MVPARDRLRYVFCKERTTKRYVNLGWSGLAQPLLERYYAILHSTIAERSWQFLDRSVENLNEAVRRKATNIKGFWKYYGIPTWAQVTRRNWKWRHY